MLFPDEDPRSRGLEAFTIVRFEPARSADPPRSSGMAGTSTSSTFCDALRVATVSAFWFVSSTRAFSLSAKPSGKRPEDRRRNSAASVGNWAEYFLKRAFHFFSARLPASRASQRARTASGISNGGYGQPMAWRVAAISSAPSGAPCAAPVLAFFGAPLAMTVLQQMRVGRDFDPGLP